MPRSMLTKISAGAFLAATATLAVAIEPYQAHTIESYHAPTVKQYRAPTTEAYRARQGDRYQGAQQIEQRRGGEIRQYRSGQVQKYEGGGTVRRLTRKDFEEMHRNDVAAGRTHESMSKGRGANGGEAAARDRLNHYSNMNALNNRMDQAGTIGYNPFRNQ